MNIKNYLIIIFLLSYSFSFAQLGVGTTTPNPSAQLDVVSNDSGILIPNLSLTSLTDATTISNGNTESLLVYNTSAFNGLTPGYYYWSNGVWNRLAIQEEVNNLPRNVVSSNNSVTGVADNAALVAMDLEVNVDDSTIEVDATNGLQVKDDGITTTKILNDNVTVSKMGAVIGDANKLLGTDATGNVEWQDAATIATGLGEDVTSTNGSITGIAGDAALVAMDLEVNADDSTIEVDATNGLQLKDAGIVASKIADNAITNSKIIANAVDGTKIQVTGEAEGSMLFNNGTDWLNFPKGDAGQVLQMNAAGTAPEWATPAAKKRIGEFIYSKSGRTAAQGYLAVTPGTITNGAVTYPVWAAQYPEYVSGNNIVFPSNVAGMFLRNVGGNAGTQGASQNDATARPNNNFTTNTTGNHSHSLSGSYTQSVRTTGFNTVTGKDNSSNGEYDVGSAGVPTINNNGNHAHTITNGGDNETRPANRAYQLYTIVDTY